MSIFDIAVERDLSSPTQVIRNFKIEFRRKVSLRGNGDLLQNDYFVISLQLFRYLFRYFVISLQLFRYFVISLFRYFVISLFRYFVISLFRYFVISRFSILVFPSSVLSFCRLSCCMVANYSIIKINYSVVCVGFQVVQKMKGTHSWVLLGALGCQFFKHNYS
jgi:hypothetical protein